jgi:hypothetical protein
MEDDMTKPDITAAGIAKALGVSPREARMKLRAAGIRAPYKPSDVAKMKAVIKGDKAPAAKPQATGKAKGKAKAAQAPAVSN